MQEVGHFLAAFPNKLKLGIPYFIPNITLGSFGAITQVSISNHYCAKFSCKDLTTKALFILLLMVHFLRHLLSDWMDHRMLVF